MTAPDLTLPGAIPGLLRRGSVVIIDDEVCGAVWGEHLDTGLVVVFDAHRSIGRLVPAGDIALDLRDATGRAHAAWWLAERSPYGKVWTRRQTRENVWLFPVPAARVIADLDPNDPRLLPDGSRWVDAEALRRVVLHVAGVRRG